MDINHSNFIVKKVTPEICVTNHITVIASITLTYFTPAVVQNYVMELL